MAMAMQLTSEPPLPLERYAETTAAIDAGVARDQALARIGLSADQWLLVQQYWLWRFGAEAGVRIFESSKVFQRIYLQHRTSYAAKGLGRVPTKAPASGPTSAPVSSGERPLPPPEASPSLPQVGANAAANGPRLTLPQYASLCVELTLYPQQTDVVRQRYGLDDGSLFRENAEWQWRFQQDPTLHDRYSQLFQQYRDWLVSAAQQPSK
jgi:hypothetical protein